MSFLDNLHWRYATKVFDTAKKISREDLDKILEAIRLTPTSFGLQPYHFYVVENAEIRQSLKAAAWNQPQIDTSSYVIAFSARKDLVTTKDEFFEYMSGGDAAKRESLAGYENMIAGAIGGLEKQGAVLKWSSEQAHIALGF